MAWGKKRPPASKAVPELGPPRPSARFGCRSFARAARRQPTVPIRRAASAASGRRPSDPPRGAVGASELAGVCQTLLLRLSGAALGPLAAPAVALVAVHRQLFSRPLCGPLSPLAPHEGRDLLWRALRACRVLPPSGPCFGATVKAALAALQATHRSCGARLGSLPIERPQGSLRPRGRGIPGMSDQEQSKGLTDPKADEPRRTRVLQWTKRPALPGPAKPDKVPHHQRKFASPPGLPAA